MDERIKIDAIICDLAYIYGGAASFAWLENQPLSRLVVLKQESERIAKESNKK